MPNHALRKRIEEHEVELDRTLERVAEALEARAEEQLAQARLEISTLQRQLSGDDGAASTCTPMSAAPSAGAGSCSTVAAPRPAPDLSPTRRASKRLRGPAPPAIDPPSLRKRRA